MAYATVDQLRRYIQQAPDGSDEDVRLAEILDRASAIVDLVVGYTFDTATVGTRVVYGDGTSYLPLPPFETGTVTTVTSISSVTVPNYVVEGNSLRAVDSQGIKPSYPRTYHRHAWYTGYEDDVTNGHVVLFGGGRVTTAWRAGVPYTVSAAWGSASINPAVVEATLEIAADIYKTKDAGFATVIGVEGAGAVNIRNALPLKAKTILDALTLDTSGAGVY